MSPLDHNGVPFVDPLDLYGIKRRVVEQADGELAFHATQDVQPILDFNKEMFGDPGRGYTPSKDMRHIAEIPLVVAEEWKNRFGVDVFNKDHAPAVKRLLNDPDWRYLRTAPGCV